MPRAGLAGNSGTNPSRDGPVPGPRAGSCASADRRIGSKRKPRARRGKAGERRAHTMLFVALLSAKPGSTFQEGGARRLQWGYPEGMNVLGEY